VYALGYISDNTMPFNEATIKGQVKEFYNTWVRTRALSERVSELANAEMLSREFFNRHQQLLFDFRNLYVELHPSLTPAQQMTVARWLMDVTPKMAAISTRKLLAGMGDLGIAPLVIPIVLVVAGVVTTIMVSKVIADALAAYNAELSRQEKELSWVSSVQKDVRDGVVTFDQGIKLLEAKPRGVIPDSPIIKPAGMTGGSIIDTIGRNLTTVALIGILGFVLVTRK
jgi:hypothetical protein